MTTEVIWFTVPICGLLRQIGGTFNKAVDRIGTPLLITLTSAFIVGWKWWLVLIFLSYFAVKTLPFTLKGDSVKDWWFNWVWIWILGLLNGLACLSLAIPLGLTVVGLWLSLIPMVTFGIFGTLSNVPSTSKWFVWKFCEAMFGISMAIPPIMLLQQVV